MKKSRKPKLPGYKIFCIYTQLLCCSFPTSLKILLKLYIPKRMINVWRTVVLYELF